MKFIVQLFVEPFNRNKPQITLTVTYLKIFQRNKVIEEHKNCMFAHRTDLSHKKAPSWINELKHNKFPQWGSRGFHIWIWFIDLVQSVIEKNSNIHQTDSLLKMNNDSIFE